MTGKIKMPLSGNSMAWAGSFVNHTKTNHSHTYNKKKTFFLVIMSFYGRCGGGTCERDNML